MLGGQIGENNQVCGEKNQRQGWRKEIKDPEGKEIKDPEEKDIKDCSTLHTLFTNTTFYFFAAMEDDDDMAELAAWAS